MNIMLEVFLCLSNLKVALLGTCMECNVFYCSVVVKFSSDLVTISMNFTVVLNVNKRKGKHMIFLTHLFACTCTIDRESFGIDNFLLVLHSDENIFYVEC